jgi:hypothetical protein
VQFVHSEAPSAAENLPAAHSVQTEAPCVEYLPATQLVQTVSLVCAGEPKNVPAAQLVQTAAPAGEIHLSPSFWYTTAHGTFFLLFSLKW